MKYLAFVFMFAVCSTAIAADDANTMNQPSPGVRVCGNQGVGVLCDESKAYTKDTTGFQFGKQNSLRLRFGGGVPVLFGDLLGHMDHGDHGGRFTAFTGDVKVATTFFESKKLTLDAAFGPEFMGAVNGTKGTSYGVGLDVRSYYTGFRDSTCSFLKIFQPFVSAGTGVNWMDVNYREGGTKIGLPLKAGVGARFLLTERLSATAEYSLYHLTGGGENFFDNGHTSYGTSTDLFMVGLEFKL